jgi:hypothetical protein
MHDDQNPKKNWTMGSKGDGCYTKSVSMAEMILGRSDGGITDSS